MMNSKKIVVAMAMAMCVVPVQANVSDSIKQQQGGTTSQSVGIQTHQTSIGMAEQHMTTPQYTNSTSSVVVIPQKAEVDEAENGATGSGITGTGGADRTGANETESTENEMTSQGLTPTGNFTLTDDIVETSSAGTSDSTEFMTVVTKGGNYLYLVVDRKNEKENVHLLNMVDESDLIALINDEDVPYEPSEIVADDSLVTDETVEDETETVEVEKDETTENTNWIRVLLGLALFGGLGYFAYKKINDRTSTKELDQYFESDLDDVEVLSEEELQSMIDD